MIFNMFQSFLLINISFFFVACETEFSHSALCYIFFLFFLLAHGLVSHLPKLQTCSKCFCRTLSHYTKNDVSQ